MTQAEFIARLDRLIAALPAEERRRATEFYSELILDRMENGKTEEEAVADCGPVEEIAEKVMAAYTPVRQPSLFLRVMKIIALIFGVPILLSIAIPLAAAAFVLGLVGVVGTAFVLPQSLPAGVFQLGAGLLFCGLCLLSLVGAVKLFQLLLRFTVWLAGAIANSFRRKKWLA